jgi:hypothetical protein
MKVFQLFAVETHGRDPAAGGPAGSSGRQNFPSPGALETFR